MGLTIKIKERRREHRGGTHDLKRTLQAFEALYKFLSTCDEVGFKDKVRE